eukprot:1195958-Prorocentrum_minimum.AAC.3
MSKAGLAVDSGAWPRCPKACPLSPKGRLHDGAWLGARVAHHVTMAALQLSIRSRAWARNVPKNAPNHTCSITFNDHF